ncbi:MAG TPA: site-2 protease family protein [Chthoniobacterales bacterium]|jgi:Zn-dependent protease
MRTGAIRLFRFAGVTVYLHFSWFLIAAIYMTSLARRYQSPIWGVLEYLALFCIVLMHEFGHALACRQVGGVADRIILWPLGGIAYVNPPPRPGAYLWSIAAGPLVNVALVPIIGAVSAIVPQDQFATSPTDTALFFSDLNYINWGLLIFNILPIFPLDGGQILRGLLWFPLGPLRSLQIASVVGLVGGALLALAGLLWQSIWTAILAFFLLSRAWVGWQQAKAMIAAAERGFAVPPSPTVPVDEPRR